MPNYKNIEPYSKAAHIMAQYGGPEMFKEYLLQKGYQVGFEMGKQAEKSTELWKIPLAVLSGFVILCNTSGTYIKRKRQVRKQNLVIKSRKLKNKTSKEMAWNSSKCKKG